jgi:hypothetical protein
VPLGGGGFVDRRTNIPGYREFPKPVTTTRRRALITKLPNARFRFKRTYDGNVTIISNVVTSFEHHKSLNGTQITVSENHPSWRRRSKQDPVNWDDGGPFYSQRRFCRFIGSPMATLQGIDKDGETEYLTTYSGPCLPAGYILDGMRWPDYQASSEGQLNAFGTTAIARCKPAQPTAGLATALIELRREGLPSLVGAETWKARTAKARLNAAGGEYLNIEFGWKPLVNEIVNVAITIDQSERLINQYLRDAGRQVRRRYEFPPYQVQSTIVDQPNCSPYLASSGGGLYWSHQMNQGRVILHRSVEKRCWFSGAFVYYLPTDSASGRAKDGREGALQRLLGFDLTPDTLWNAAPWSWAVDWMSNLGDVISNLQSWQRDGMAMRYGYVMEHVLHTHTYSFAGHTGFRSGYRPPVVQFVAETKRRCKASPFAFGQKYGQFTDRQWAIVAALGLSKA